MANFTVSDLDIMSIANNYNKWLCGLIDPFLSGCILEIGSGTGNLTRLIIEKCKKVSELTCVEIDSECVEELKKNLDKLEKDFPVNIYTGDFMHFNTDKRFDAVFAMNVFEHIEDHAGALDKIHSFLNEGGRIVLLVPAFQFLYGFIDKELKHYRRYGKKELESVLKDAGFNVEFARYYNTVGFFGWWVNNRLLKKRSQSLTQVRIFDRIILPTQSRVESVLSLPFGQNLFCVGQKKPK